MTPLHYGVASSHLARRERHRNHWAVIIAPPEGSDGDGVVMTHRPPTRQRDSSPVPSQEDRLLDLLRKAESYAYALAHGYDIGGHTDRADGLVAVGERIRDTATDVSGLARPAELHSAAPALGLRWRAFSLRRLLRGTAWQGPSMAPLVPKLAGEQTEHVPLRKVTAK